MIDFTPDPIAPPARVDQHLLVRGRLCRGPRGDLRGRGARGAAARPRPEPHPQRHDHGRRGGADRRPAVPRHRPVAAVQGRSAQDRPAAVQRPGRLRGDRHRDGGGDPLRPLEAPPFWTWADVVAPGGVRDAGHRPLGELLQPGALRAADEPAVGHRDRLRPPGRRRGAVPAGSARRHGRRRTSTRCSCTSRFRGCSGRSSSSFLARRLGSRLRPGDLVLLFFIWYGTIRFALETLRSDNWTVIGIPVAPIVSALLVRRCGALVCATAWRHRPGGSGAPIAEPRATPRRPTTRAPPRRGAAAGSAASRGGRAGAGANIRPDEIRAAAARHPRGARLARAPPAAGLGRLSAGPRRSPDSCCWACSGSGYDARGRSTSRPAAATSSSARSTGAGWTRSSSSTPLPAEPRAWFLGSAATAFDRRWKERLLRRLGGHAAGLARRRRRRGARRLRRGPWCERGGVFVLFAGGRRSAGRRTDRRRSGLGGV